MTFIPKWAESIKAPEQKYSAEEIADVRSITELHPQQMPFNCQEFTTERIKRETITLKGRKNGRR